MKTLYPDYRNSNMNISCSILRYFGCDPHHETLEDLDRIFDERKPRNVVFMLFDAMGISIIDRHLSASSFIKKHVLDFNVSANNRSSDHINQFRTPAHRDRMARLDNLFQGSRPECRHVLQFDSEYP